MESELTGEAIPKDVEDVVNSYLNDSRLPALIDRPSLGMRHAQMLSSLTTMNVRLPRLGEWYLAMRGGEMSVWWWGDEWQPDKVVASVPLEEAHWLSRLSPVKGGQPNPFGLYHMVGNVAQLVYPSDKERRVLRQHFGPWAPAPVGDQPRGSRSSYQIFEYSTLDMGGSVRAHPDTLAKWSVDLAAIIGEGIFGGSRQNIDRFPNGFQQMVGVRLVIEIPEGEFEVRHTQDKNH